jgi:hypothetical protein
MSGKCRALAHLRRKTSGTHCTRGWVDLGAGLGVYLNLSSAPGSEPRSVQLVAGRYTDHAIPSATSRHTTGRVKQKERSKTCNVRIT